MAKVSYKLEQKRLLITAPLVALAILVSVANQHLLNSEARKENQARSIASVARAIGVDTGQNQWEFQLAKRLALADIPEARDPAMIGRDADPMDDFRFGILENKYNLILEDGKIREISFIDNDSLNETLGDRPKYISDLEGTEAFLENNKDLFAVEFKKARPVVTRVIPDQGKTEVYELVENNLVRGEAELNLDSSGRFISLRVVSRQ